MDIYAVHLKKRIPESVFDKLFSFVSSDKQSRCKRFLRIEDAERLLVADALVRHYICCKYKYQNNMLLFENNAYGKPFLKNNSNVHFNITHSGEWVAAAFDQNEIGIDVEKIKSIDIKIAKRFFSEKEYQNLMKYKGIDRNAYFFDLWVLKESYIKAVGKGLYMGLDTFSFSFEKDTVYFESEDQCRNFFFKQYHLDPSYKFAVCAKHKRFPEKIKRINIDDINI